MNSSAESFVSQIAEPTLDEVQPRGISRSEMEMVTGLLYEPALDESSLMSGVVVQDYVDVKIGWDYSGSFGYLRKVLDFGHGDERSRSKFDEGV